MKRFFSFLALTVLFTSCDDGDMQEVSFEFDNTSAKACNVSGLDRDFFIYKTTDQRAILLQLSEKSFPTTITADTLDGFGIPLDLGTTNKLIYRVYSDNITEGNICSAIPPSFPVVTEERIAAGGKALITTTAIKTFNETNGSSAIANYRHTITFSDITFNVGDGSQRNESLPPIIYEKAAAKFTPFDTTSELNPCTDENPTVLYKSLPTANTTESQALVLRLTAASSALLFTTELDVTKTQAITVPEVEGGEANTLTHQFFYRTDITPLTDAYFCGTGVPPETPTVKDTWTGDVGGIIEVVTTQVDDGVYKHTVTLRNIKMKKRGQDFLLKSEFVFGSFEVQVP